VTGNYLVGCSILTVMRFMTPQLRLWVEKETSFALFLGCAFSATLIAAN
jgi:hypothetical protein